jgi:hypothetical protein
MALHLASARRSARKGSLADEIAALLNPAPAGSDDEEDGSLTAAERPSLLSDADRAAAAQPASAGRRMRGSAIQMSEVEAARYAGRRVNRSELLRRGSLQQGAGEGVGREDEEDEEAVDEDEEDGDEEDEDEDEDDDEDEDEDEDENEDEDEEENADEDEDEDEDGEEDELDEDDEDDYGEEGCEEESEDGLGGGGGGVSRRARGGDSGSLYAEWSKLAEGESALLKQLQASRTDEAEAATHAKRQHMLLMQLLHVRIKMQKAMDLAARWPAAVHSPLWDATSALRERSAGAAAALRGLLSELLGVRAAVARAHAGEPCDAAGAAGAGVSGPPPPPLDEPSVDAWWRAVSAGDEAMAGATAALVEEAEAAAGADGAPLRSGRTFAAAGGVLAQAEHVLAQMPPGSEVREQKAHATGALLLGLRAPTGAAGAGAAGSGAAGGSVGAEVYDDAPFYHTLLRSLLEEGGGAEVGGAPKLKRTKRRADSRQSKGRRLSYEAQPPLQNFMFPVVPGRPVALSELFSSVFGRRPVDDATPAYVPPPGATPAGAARAAKRRCPEGHASALAAAVAEGDEIEHPNLFMR